MERADRPPEVQENTQWRAYPAERPLRWRSKSEQLLQCPASDYLLPSAVLRVSRKSLTSAMI
jgi:hypothetical protein